MRLGERETAARRDAQIRGAEAFMAGELDDDHLARHFDGWVRHEHHMHPPTDRCKVCCTDEIERLRGALRKYGTHVGLCGARMRGSDCDCGLEELQHG